MFTDFPAVVDEGWKITMPVDPPQTGMKKQLSDMGMKEVDFNTGNTSLGIAVACLFLSVFLGTLCAVDAKKLKSDIRMGKRRLKRRFC